MTSLHLRAVFVPIEYRVSIYDTDIFDVISRVRSLYQPSEVKQSQFHLASKQSCLFTDTSKLHGEEECSMSV